MKFGKDVDVELVIDLLFGHRRVFGLLGNHNPAGRRDGEVDRRRCVSWSVGSKPKEQESQLMRHADGYCR